MREVFFYLAVYVVLGAAVPVGSNDGGSSIKSTRCSCKASDNRVFAMNIFTENSFSVVRKCQIHSGILLVVFAANESLKRLTQPPYHRRGAGRQHQSMSLYMVL